MMWRYWIIGVCVIVFLGMGPALAEDLEADPPAAPIEITTPALPSGYTGDGYSTLLESTGGQAAPYFMSGSLPKGLSLSFSGQLSGSLKITPGAHTFLVTAVAPNDPGNYTDRELTLTVFGKLVIEKQTLAPAMTGQPYSRQLTFSGGSPACTLAVTGLPPGLTMDGKGLITGTPETGAATHELDLTVTDPDFPNHTATRRFRLTVYDALAIVTESPAPVQVNTGLSLRLTTSGGSGKALFRSPDLPQGLILNETGHLSGTPALSRGIYPFLVTATDTRMPVTVEKTLTLTLVDFFPDAFENLEISDRNTFKPGDPIQEHTFNEPGDQDKVRLDLTQTPAGDVIRLVTHKRSKATQTRLAILGPDGKAIPTVDESGGDGYAALLFVCETPGFYPVTIDETTGETGDYGLSLTVLGPKIALTTASFPDQQNMGPVDLMAMAEKGSGDDVFGITGLPSALSMDETGHIKGQLTAPAGVYPLTLTVRDRLWGNLSATTSFPLTVVDFFPDAFETQDGDTGTANIMLPDAPVQHHTFHTPGDRDVVNIDLSGMEPDHVLHFQTKALTRETHTTLRITDEHQVQLATDKDAPTPLSDLYVDAAAHPALFLFIDETRGRTGDYGLAVTDTGRKLSIRTDALPDALTKGPYSCQIQAVDGSGAYKFSGHSLPKGLSMDTDGLLHGDLTLAPGIYGMSITVEDTQFTGMSHTLPLSLTVVEFFPDSFEALSDNGFGSTATLLPDGSIQEHTLHRPGDQDMIRLDLSNMPQGHVLDIRTHSRTKPTVTFTGLYDSAQALMMSDQNKDAAKRPTSRLVTVCPGPGIYFIGVKTRDDQVGDYAVSVTDGGPKVRLVDQDMPDVLINNPMAFQLMAADGSGQYDFSIRAGSLPSSLTLKQDGLISGGISVPAGLYPFEITVSDPVFPGITDSKPYTLTVVDYFPDDFDVMGDADEQTRNIMAPGGDAQHHCFHESGDVDWIRLDLKEASPQDVIIIGLSWPGKETHTELRLIDAKGQPQDLVDKGRVQVLSLTDPGELLLCVTEKENRTGEYTLSLSNSGQPVSFYTSSLGFAESVHPFDRTIEAQGGCGAYRFSIIQGTLPAGLSLDEHTGRISGQTTAWGSFTLTVLALDQRFPVNSAQRTFSMEAYMGEKLHGEARFEFPHYLSGTFSLDTRLTRTEAFPGDIKGGTPGNLRYRITNNAIPDNRFTHTFDPKTGTLTLTETAPVSCNQYTNTTLHVDVEVKDSVYTNNVMTFVYDIPAECMDY